MKAHRFKTKHRTRWDVTMEFEKELSDRLTQRALREKTGQGVIKICEHRCEIYAEEKLKLLKEWESKGRSTAFNKEPLMKLLEMQYYPERFKLNDERWDWVNFFTR